MSHVIKKQQRKPRQFFSELKASWSLHHMCITISLLISSPTNKVLVLNNTIVRYLRFSKSSALPSVVSFTDDIFLPVWRLSHLPRKQRRIITLLQSKNTSQLSTRLALDWKLHEVSLLQSNTPTTSCAKSTC